MDRTSMDHYEKQLYSVFKTFDVDNEEALDRAAVLDLCDALQLEDRGAALVDTLFERPAERVTFTQFRNGLLSVLGGGAAAPPVPSSPPATDPALPHSDDDSSGREVAPKFVVGAKKYGRRSRPPSATASPRPPTPDSVRLEAENDRLKLRMKCKRSALSMDGTGENSSASTPEPNGNLDHDRRIDYEQSLELCRSLHMDGIDRRIVERIFEDASSNDITVGEFFDRLNASLTMSIASSCSGSEVAGEVSDEASWGPGSALAADAVTEAWERAGVEHARRLLLELGFAAPTLRASDLLRALDAELRTLAPPPPAPPDARALLLQAALALQRLRLSHAKQLVDASRAENTKLRNDLADANRRAQTLALEVDENHARIEASLKGRIKQLEIRHAEESRLAAAEWAAERERVASTVAKLEEQVSRLVGEEARLRADANALRDQNGALSRRASLAEERASELESMRQQLQSELRSLVSRSEEPIDQQGLSPEFAARISDLQLENKQLRDRNDELCAELEAAARAAGPDAGPGGTSWREEVAGVRPGRPRDDSLASLHSAQNCSDECDQSLISLDQKVFGHIEVVRRLQGVLETVPQVSLTNDSGCESCGTLKGIITTIQERVQELSDSVILADTTGLKTDISLEVGVQTEPQNDQQIERLKKEMAEVEQKHTDENERLSNLVKDLETSLDQMKMEYDKCEEYWASKLNEERDIYAEEQKISDERLTELINKISEYEQQFAPKSNSNQLPTIDEKYSLELQFTDLEDEFEKYKQQKENEIDSKDDEIEQLKQKIKVLQEKRIANGHSTVSSPIDYLWSQGTITTPYNKNDKQCVRDYQNPAYVRNGDCKEDNVRCSSDSERDKPVSPIQRPPRSASAGALRDEVAPPREIGEPQMINCADLEGQLRQQAQLSGTARSHCACATLEVRCRQLVAALRHRQLCLDAVQQAARSEGAVLRARVSAAEAAVAKLQARLAAADLLVKDLYLENCQLAHHQTRLL